MRPMLAGSIQNSVDFHVRPPTRFAVGLKALTNAFFDACALPFAASALAYSGPARTGQAPLYDAIHSEYSRPAAAENVSDCSRMAGARGEVARWAAGRGAPGEAPRAAPAIVCPICCPAGLGAREQEATRVTAPEMRAVA